MDTRSRFPRHQTTLKLVHTSESVVAFIAALIALGYLASFLVWPIGERHAQVSVNSVDPAKVEPVPQFIPLK